MSSFKKSQYVLRLNNFYKPILLNLICIKVLLLNIVLMHHLIERNK